MKTKIYLLLVLALLITISCSRNDENSAEQPISFVEIGKAALYGAGAEGIPQSNMLIANNTDWQNLMNQMNTVNNVTDTFTETNIDFNTYMVIAVFLEVKGSGWEVTITDIVENANDITVSIEDKAFETSVMTQPYHIVKIPIIDKPVVFD